MAELNEQMAITKFYMPLESFKPLQKSWFQANLLLF